jgi:hypothetical protein
MARESGKLRIDLESVAFALIMALVGAAAAIGGGIVTAWCLSSGQGGPPYVAGIVGMLVGIPLALLGFRRWRLGPKHVLVESAAGTIELVLGEKRMACSLAELKPSLERYAHRNAYGRHMQDRYRVLAAGLNVYLIDTSSERTAKQVCERLQELVSQQSR